MVIDRTTDQFLLDAYEGTGGFHYGYYLVQHPREDDDKFARRKAASEYTNFTATIGDIFIGYLWSKSPSRTDISDNYAAFVANANGIGTGLNAVLLGYQQLALILGTVYIIVDKPQQMATSRADEALPYLAIRTKSQVNEEKTNHLGELVSITFSELNNNGKTIVRTFTEEGWTVIDDGMTTTGSYNLKRVPVVKLHGKPPLLHLTNRSLCRRETTTFLQAIIRQNWKLYNLESELDELLRKQTFAILTYPVPDSQTLEKLKQTGLTVGTENGIAYVYTGGKPELISPDAANVQSYLNRIATVINNIYRAANLEFLGSGQLSGEALALLFNQLNARLITMAEQCETAEKQIKRLVDNWMGSQDSPGTVCYNNDFNIKALATELKLKSDALLENISPTFNQEVKKRIAKLVLDDAHPETMLKIEAEIDANGDVYQQRIDVAANVNTQ